MSRASFRGSLAGAGTSSAGRLERSIRLGTQFPSMRRNYALQVTKGEISISNTPIGRGYVSQPPSAPNVLHRGQEREFFEGRRNPQRQPARDFQGGAGFRAPDRLPPAQSLAQR